MSDVRLENVRKSFKDMVAVDDLSLTVEAGVLLAAPGSAPRTSAVQTTAR